MTRRNYSAGFTLMELMLAVAIVGILAGLAIPAYLVYLDKARIARCIAEIRSIEKSIKIAYITTEMYPISLAEIGAGYILDPWGTPYQYGNLTAAVPVSRVVQPQREDQSAWSWFAPSPAYATPSPSNPGQGNQGGGGNNASATKNGGGQGSGNGGGKGNSLGKNPGSLQTSSVNVAPRTDRFGVSLNTDFDLYSMGKDRDSAAALSTPKSYDDIVRANDGAFVGLASDF